MSRFVKITVQKDNPIGGGSHPCDIWLNVRNIICIEQFSDDYRIKLVGKEEFIVSADDYNTIVKQLREMWTDEKYD